jgi:hypothetical protein
MNYDIMSIQELEQLARVTPKSERTPILRAIAKRENTRRHPLYGRPVTEVNYGLHDL